MAFMAYIMVFIVKSWAVTHTRCTMFAISCRAVIGLENV